MSQAYHACPRGHYLGDGPYLRCTDKIGHHNYRQNYYEKKNIKSTPEYPLVLILPPN